MPAAAVERGEEAARRRGELGDGTVLGRLQNGVRQTRGPHSEDSVGHGDTPPPPSTTEARCSRPYSLPVPDSVLDMRVKALLNQRSECSLSRKRGCVDGWRFRGECGWRAGRRRGFAYSNLSVRPRLGTSTVRQSFCHFRFGRCIPCGRVHEVERRHAVERDAIWRQPAIRCANSILTR